MLLDEVTTLEAILVESRTIYPEGQETFKAVVLDHLDAVVAHEVNERPGVGGSPIAEEKFTAVLAMVEAGEAILQANPLKAAEAASFFEEASELIKAREVRVNQVSAELDHTIVLILITLALLTVASVALLPSTGTLWAKWVASLGVAVSVGLLMSLVFYIASDEFTRSAEEQQVLKVRQAELQRPLEFLGLAR